MERSIISNPLSSCASSKPLSSCASCSSGSSSVEEILTLDFSDIDQNNDGSEASSTIYTPPSKWSKNHAKRRTGEDRASKKSAISPTNARVPYKAVQKARAMTGLFPASCETRPRTTQRKRKKKENKNIESNKNPSKKRECEDEVMKKSAVTPRAARTPYRVVQKARAMPGPYPSD